VLGVASRGTSTMRAYLLVQACPHFSADAASRDASFKPPSALPQVYGL